MPIQLPQLLQELVFFIESRSASVVQIQEAEEYLSQTQDLNKLGIGLNENARAEVQAFCEEEIQTRPIRRCDVDYEQPEFIRLVERVKVSRDWTEEEQKKLMLLWKMFIRDRESLLHDLIRLWNAQRDLFTQFNKVVPILNGSLGILDTKIHQRISQMDKFFTLTLTVCMMEKIGEDIPENWHTVFERGANGQRVKDITLTEEEKSEILEHLLAKYDGDGSKISPLDKKLAAQKTGKSLEDVKHFLNSRIDIFQEFMGTKPAFPPIVTDTPMEEWPFEDSLIVSGSELKEEPQVQPDNFEAFFNLDNADTLPNNWLGNE